MRTRIGRAAVWLGLGVCVALLCTLASGARAGVVYNWVPLEINPELGDVTGRIEIRDEVWRSGAYQLTLNIAAGQYRRASEVGVEAVDVYIPHIGPYFSDVYIRGGALPCGLADHATCGIWGIGLDGRHF